MRPSAPSETASGGPDESEDPSALVAGYFRNAVALDQWRQTLEGLHRPLGGVLSRELLNATYATELPGASDGQYVVIQFNTAFENKRAAVETVTPMLEADGGWRIAGYFVR